MASVENHTEKISKCNRVGDLYQYEGFWNYKGFVKGTMAAQENFEARPTDIFLASHMKTGTTWLKSLAFAIATRKTFSTSPLLTKMPHDCVPLLEFDLSEKSLTNRNNEIPLIATHMPYTSLPKSVLESGCKIVYIWRDAKDVFVSFWYFIVKIAESMNALEPPPPMEEAFEQFCKGIFYCGPYWNHVLGYWKAKLEFPDKILFLKYEDMKEDTRAYVKELATFIEYPFSLEEEENGAVEKIISLCSFDSLSNFEVNKTGKHREDTPLALNNEVYFRKGETGDWKNVLTPEMGARLDSIMEEKLSASGLLK